jgi:hypothetical protein
MTSRIKLFPEIIWQAKRKNLPLGAFRLWFIAKSFDNGNGNILAKIFRQYLRSLNIKQTTFYKWREQARTLGLIEDTGKVYRLASWEWGAIAAGCTHLNRAVWVPTKSFVAKKWLGSVWEGYLLYFHGKPVTRGTLEKLTGIPERTQQIYEKNAGVNHIENYFDFGSVKDHPILAIDTFVTPRPLYQSRKD